MLPRLPKLLKTETAANVVEPEMEHARGVVDYIIREQPSFDGLTNWYLLSCRDPKTNKMFTALGSAFQIHVNDYLEFSGKWQQSKYRKEKEFKFNIAVKCDDDAFGAYAMLSFVFGQKRAKNIFDYYGDALLAYNTFKDSPEQFLMDSKQIKGIGKRIIEKGREKFEKHISVDKLYLRFSRYGISVNIAIKIVKEWGELTNKIIDENPYALLNIDGCIFETVDRIARNYYHIGIDDSRRVEAGVTSCLKYAIHNGNCYMRLQDLIIQSAKKLAINYSSTNEKIAELIREKKLILDKKDGEKDGEVIYFPHIYYAEEYVAKNLMRRLRKNRLADKDKMNNYIEWYQKQKHITLAPKQIEAVVMACTNQFSIISGPPGSGKTTIIDLVCNIFRDSMPKASIALAAPTGRAAKRMMETTKLPASTVHRLLGSTPRGEFIYNERNKIPNLDVLIVDEFSMEDVLIFHHLLKALDDNTILILVGDKDQLDSVDCGQVLNDLLRVNSIPKSILDEIYRQKSGSTILNRVMDFKHQRMPDLTSSNDFDFLETKDNTLSVVLNEYFYSVDEYGLENTSLLIPQNKGDIGVNAMNVLIQNKVNPPSPQKEEMVLGKRVFREGDLVLQLINRAEKHVYNGMVGKITEIVLGEDKLDDYIVVDFDGHVVEYYRDDMDEIKLAYAMTVHKAQGSEYRNVIMLLDEQHIFMCKKRLIYTGMTRAKERLVIVGQSSVLKHAIETKEKERNTMLQERCQKYEEEE